MYIRNQIGMLQVRKNEISLRKCSGSSANLRTLEGILVTRESARFYNNNSESKSQIRLLSLLYLSFSIFQRHILSKAFCYFPNVRMRTSVFREEAFADHKVEEYQNKL